MVILCKEDSDNKATAELLARKMSMRIGEGQSIQLLLLLSFSNLLMSYDIHNKTQYILVHTYINYKSHLIINKYDW